MSRIPLSPVLALCLLLASSARAADEAPDLQKLLARQVIGPERSMAEVQDFCEARIPAMPPVPSAAEWQKTADAIRADVLARVVFRGQAKAWRDVPAKVEWLDTIDGGPGYRIRKLRYEALPGLWIPALLYEPLKLEGKVPVVLNVNGHDSAGKAAGYKQIRCINLAKRGVLALNVEWLGMGQLGGPTYAHYRMNQLDLCGTAGIATHYLAMSRAIDLLLAHPHADPARVGVTGLSGGGWQTIFISSLDTRVTLTNPVAGYSSFKTRVRNLSDLGDSEQTPSDLAAYADYAHLTAMMAPRAALLTFNAKDNCCFAAGHAMAPLVDAAGPVFAAFGKRDHLRTHVNEVPGTHNYERDNRQAFYKMVGDHFFPGHTDYSAEEIESGKEVRKKQDLEVELPAGNATFNSLAMALAKDLPRDAGLPTEKAAAERWQKDRRAALRGVVRFKDYAAKAEQVAEETRGDLKVVYWRLRLADEWTVPAVELVRGEPKTTALLVSDVGRAASAEAVGKLLAEGHRVLAVDPFYFGESKVAKKDLLFALLVASTGERPMGIQAGQVAAVARWSKATQGSPVTVVAAGPRTSTISLVAAAAEESAIAGVQLHKPLGSFKEVLEESRPVSETPELFCFGLLERFDVPQIAALVAPRPVRLVDPSPRAKAELEPVAAWAATVGGKVGP